MRRGWMRCVFLAALTGLQACAPVSNSHVGTASSSSDRPRPAIHATSASKSSGDVVSRAPAEAFDRSVPNPVPSRPPILRIAEPAECGRLRDPARSTFVLHAIDGDVLRVCNPTRAHTRFTPASTFKVPHALLAIEHGVIEKETTPLAWDGLHRGVQGWDQDTSLSEAIGRSTVWVFQDIASRLGVFREAEGLLRLRYGNADAGRPEDLRSFWLSGPLAISAVEQVEFLNRLRLQALDAPPEAQTRTIAMLVVRRCGDRCIIYWKTGAVLPINDSGALRPGEVSLLPPGEPPIGWFVGWVERPAAEGGPLVFAHNIDLGVPGAMAARTEVVWDILRINGVAMDGE